MHEIIADSNFGGITSGVRFVPSEEKMRICFVYGVLIGPRSLYSDRSDDFVLSSTENSNNPPGQTNTHKINPYELVS